MNFHRFYALRVCMRRKESRWISVVMVFLITAPFLTSQTDRFGSQPVDPGVRSGPVGAGEPLPLLSTGQLQMFTRGKDAFEEVNAVVNPPAGEDAGLGPRFNSDSCVSCHAQPAIGGSSPAVNPQFDVASKRGADNRIPWFLERRGPAREVRFIRNPDGTPDGGVHNLFVISGRTDARGCNLRQEDFSNRSNLSFRVPTPVFGAGLMEAITDETLLANLEADGPAKLAAGISGKVNRNDNSGTITRFGWKAQVVSLHIFAGEAYNVEQGVSNAVFPQEREETRGCSFIATPEDGVDFETGGVDDISLFAAFMRFLAPPKRGSADPSITAGLEAFKSVGCALCHTPSLQTGRSIIDALQNKTAPLFSDLAVHGMGPGLADQITQGRALGDEFRTAPLWGLGKRIFFLHDGRTSNLVEAIQLHSSEANGQFPASEANAVIRRFNGLPIGTRQNILNFLRSL